MQRRDILKTAGGIGAATTAGGLGLLAMTGGAAAQIEDPAPISAETNDGEIEYVAFGGLFHFSWDGLDSTAQYGSYTVETRVMRDDGTWTAWANHGADSGPLGDDTEDTASHDGDGEFEEGEKNTSATWGGDNDSNSGPTKDGYFQFKFGEPYGQKDYAIAYDDPQELDTDGDGDDEAHPVNNPWSTSRFNETDDGSKRKTQVEIRMTGRVYDADPNEGGTELISENAKAKMVVTIGNEQETADASGDLEGSVGTSEE